LKYEVSYDAKIGGFLSKKNEWEYNPDYIADDFMDAVGWILKLKGD
jgi:hypothetical protein